MEIQGRVLRIKKKGQTIFITLFAQERVQIVAKPTVFQRLGELDIQNGDLICCKVTKDEHNAGRFYSPLPSFLAVDIQLCHRGIFPLPITLSEENLRNYSQAKHRVRQFLYEAGYLEVPVPVLTDGEISSKSASFETMHIKSGKRLFLRKTMDSFLRMYSCSDIPKVYSIGPCFRNEFVTSKNLSEFEMLSVFTNYMPKSEAVLFAVKLVEQILNERVEFQSCTEHEYQALDDKRGAYAVSSFPSRPNAYARENEDGVSEEFKLRLHGVTVVHGVMEISDYGQYQKKLAAQGKSENYGELILLEQALQGGAPDCCNLGISILRLLMAYYGKSIREYDPFAFSRLRGVRRNRELHK